MIKKFFLGFCLALFAFPVFANTEIGEYTATQIEFTPLGSANTIRMGRIDEIGKFRLTNTGRKDVLIESIFLRNFSNADILRSFQGFSLIGNSRKVSIKAFPERRGVTIVFAKPFFLRKGRSTFFSLQAQLIWSRRNKSVQFGIKNVEDFIAYERNIPANAEIIDIKDNYMKKYTLRPGGLYYRSYRRSFRR